MMRAVIITRPGDVDVLQLSDVALPNPGPGQIRVKVHATAINRADLLQRRGLYPAPHGFPQNIPGLEYAGAVDACGDGVRRWRGGERVMGIVGGGSYAQYVVVHEDEALPIPDALSWEEAAAIPEAFLTAHDALRVRLGVPLEGAGESVLIHAIASGVGTAALQLARHMQLRVIGTSRSAWKLEQLARMTDAVLIDTSTQNFVDVVRAQLPAGVHYIVDLVGGEYLEKNISVAAQLGRIVLVGLVAGARATLDLRLLLNKRLTVVGTVLRARALPEKIAAARLFEEEVLPWLASREIRPVIHTVLPVSEAAEAHRLAESNQTLGKIVLSW